MYIVIDKVKLNGREVFPSLDPKAEAFSGAMNSVDVTVQNISPTDRAHAYVGAGFVRGRPIPMTLSPPSARDANQYVTAHPRVPTDVELELYLTERVPGATVTLNVALWHTQPAGDRFDGYAPGTLVAVSLPRVERVRGFSGDVTGRAADVLRSGL